MTIDAFQLYGTRLVDPPPVRLRAGKLEADLTNGNLRTIRYDGTEVLRAISYLVRDRDWGTYSPEITDLRIEQSDNRFAVAYRARCEGPDDTRLVIDVRITGSADRLDFEAEAITETGFETNRCGFCILHPIVGVAGSPATVEHVDGRIVATRFPDVIEPWQPFKDMRAITHAIMPDVQAECRMEGDTFEMEDQRNWSDASYKTYVRPLALPWPYQIAANQPVRQKTSLVIRDIGGSTRHPPAAASGGAIKLELGARTSTMPDIGVIVTPEEADATLSAKSVLSEIAPQELLFHFDPSAGHGVDALTQFAMLAAAHRGRSTLEIALPCTSSPSSEVAEIAHQMRLAEFRPDAIMISPSVDRQSTPPGSTWPECPPLDEVYTAARAAFPGIRIGGGMLSYFTELNRKRVPDGQLDFVSHCTNPIVHAADDLSVMQTLEALPFITRSVRAIYGDRPYRIGPSTIPMRQNPYGSRTMDNPSGARVPMANRDPRHNGRFAEAFALGYAIRVLDAGLECLTLSALSGPFGLIAGPAEPTEQGGRRPLFNTVRTLSRLAGASWQACVSSSPSEVLSFVARDAAGARLHVVNLTGEERKVDCGACRPADSGKELLLAPFATVVLQLAD
ncbi:D-apionate lactonase [Rhizobium leguminosarum]|uniref:D-apionate lactonase n=1 Tax=Rhizobium leguminosarum TaxID=384 RepID=UPI003F9CAC13